MSVKFWVLSMGTVRPKRTPKEQLSGENLKLSGAQEGILLSKNNKIKQDERDRSQTEFQKFWTDLEQSCGAVPPVNPPDESSPLTGDGQAASPVNFPTGSVKFSTEPVKFSPGSVKLDAQNLLKTSLKQESINKIKQDERYIAQTEFQKTWTDLEQLYGEIAPVKPPDESSLRRHYSPFTIHH